MGVSRGTSTGWYPVARATDVGTTPVPVGADGGAYVVVRLRPGGPVSAFPARCPHRLVPLAAGTVVDGRLQCGYHGWRFDAEGRCVDIPSRRPARAVGGRGAARLDLAGTRGDHLTCAGAAPGQHRARAGPGDPRAGRARVRQPRPLPRARLAPGRPVPRAPAGRLAAGAPAG